MNFTVETTDDARVVRLVGELDLASEETLTSALEPLVRQGGDVLLDLAQLAFIDSSGVRALIDGATELGDRGKLVLRSPTDPVRRVFSLMRIDTVPNVRIED